jgi:hypothetical protein
MQYTEPSGLAAIEFRETLGALGLGLQRVAELFGVKARCVRRWRRGDRPVPCGVAIVFRLLAAGDVTIERLEQVAQVEQAAAPVLAPTNGSVKSEPPVPLLVEPAPEAAAEQAVVLVPIPARMNGSAELEPPASLPGELAPEQSALARAKAATLVNSILTTAEKVCALTSNACRWPCGDPGHPNFHFCGDPVVEKPYCDHHRAMAFRPNRACSPHRVTQKALQCP